VLAKVMHWPFRLLPERGFVFKGSFHAAVQRTAGKPFAFSIEDIANGLTAGGTTVTPRITGRCHGGLIATWPVADWKGKKFSAA
jgi:hypothetical protein